MNKTQLSQGQRIILNWEVAFMNEINLSWVWDIFFEMKSLFFCLIKRTKNQGRRKLWFKVYDLLMKFICREFEMIYFEMKFLFFSLMKRTKNQGFGIVVKAQFSIFSWNYHYEALYLVRSWKADFVGDLLRSFLQTLALACFKTTHSSLNQKFNILIYIGKLRY